MATSEKVFRDLLCEGRAQPVETTDPTAARLIGELKKQTAELRAELEAERVKARQQSRDHEHELRRLREEADRKLETTVAAAVARKDYERAEEIRHLEERLFKQHENELRTLVRDKNDEIRNLHQRMAREKENSVRVAVHLEQRSAAEEMLAMVPEDECRKREHKITSEMFRLNEQNEQLEDQVRNLTRENRSQIDLIRRMRREHETALQGVIRQHQTEASREVAQLKLAERIIAEKEHDLQQVEVRVGHAVAEREAMAEELTHMRSLQALTPDLSGTGETHTPTPTGKVARVAVAIVLVCVCESCLCVCVCE